MPRSTPSARAITLLALTLLGACAVGPDYRPRTAAELALPDAYPTGVAKTANEAELQAWWTGFNDPLLAELVGRAWTGNRDIDAAEARLRAARASLKASRGGLWPALDATVDGRSTNVSDTRGGAVESWQAGFDASWEIDVFGGTRRSIEASAAEFGQARANLDDVRSSIAAEVALNYIDARSAQARLRVARDSLGSQDETVQITGWRNQAGLVSAQDVEQATVLRSQTAAAIPQLRSTYLAAANRIATLLGEPAGAVTSRLDPASDIPLRPDEIGAGVPADLLRRRPDLVSAERALAAEVARIGVAQAELYPALRLGGSLTSAALSVGNLGDVLTSSLGGSITAPLFQGGALRARVEGQRASADAALATYEGAVLAALEDVDNAMNAIDAAREREAQLAIAEQAAERSALLARTRYQSGLIDFESLLEAERSLLTTQESRLTARAARATATVQLYKALGGGWPSGVESMTRQ